MNIHLTLFLLATLTFSQLTAGETSHRVLTKKFKLNEQRNGSQFTAKLINELGSRALLKAKIMGVRVDTLEADNNTTYFRLRNYKDICRQIFINELEYIVHTKCYRDGKVLLNFVSTFEK